MVRKHWNKIYIKSRVKEWSYRRMNPWFPWITRSSIEFLQLWLKKSDNGLEFGSGRSTVWFAHRCKHLTSVEDNEAWYKIVENKLADEKLKNVSYLLRSSDWKDNEANDYIDVISTFSDNALDFVLIDGACREPLKSLALSKIKPGGLLIIDNIHWFIPYNTTSPSARTKEQGFASESWEEFFEIMNKSWRVIWTSDGVSDTAIFVKPS